MRIYGEGYLVKSLQRLLLCSASILAVAVPAIAQESVETITVTGIRESLRDSLVMKQNSPLITDNISTKDIGQLPDVTIAEELNRLPGVTTTRDRGNASQAAVRGLGPRLVFGLVNGREVASSEPSQDVRWEVYPSEVLSGAQVYKTQDATIIPGGIAATIDIRTVSPLDYEGPSLNLRAGPTYNQGGNDFPHYNTWGLRASGAYISHLTDNFAIALAASYQKEKNGYADLRSWGWNTTGTSLPSDLNGDGYDESTTWGLNSDVEEIQQDRMAVMGAAGWRPTSNLEIKFDALYSSYNIHENQFQGWFANNILGNWDGSNEPQYNCAGCSYTVVDHVIVAGHLPNENLTANYWWAGHNIDGVNDQSMLGRYGERHNLLVTGLNFNLTEGSWVAKLDLSHSQAQRKNQWIGLYLDTQFANGLDFDIGAGHAPSASFLGPVDPTDPAIQSTGGRTGEIDTYHETDHISAVALDVTRAIDGSFFTAFDAGMRMSDRAKGNQQWGYYPATATNAAGSLPGLEEFSIKTITAPPLVYGNFDELYPLVYPGAPALAVADSAELMLDNSKVHESTIEGYLKVEFAGDIGSIPMTGGLGVRVAHVGTSSRGYQTFDNQATFSPVMLTNSYTDVLPSLNATFHFTDEQQLRFGASIAVSRPPLDALIPGLNLGTNPPGCTPSPCTGGGGNPFLKPYKANQLDLSYEWYFHDESMLAAAVYYKHLLTYITALSTQEVINGLNYTITGQGNGKGGDVEGVELTFQTRFYFLPEFFSNFGTYANYAYAMSNIHEVYPIASAYESPFTMVGLTKHTAEVDLYYDNSGFEARVAYKYHSATTAAPTWVGTVLKKQDAEGLLDVSASYQWNDHIGMRLQGRNLTGTPNRYSMNNNTNELANDQGYQVFGRSFLFDISYKN